MVVLAGIPSTGNKFVPNRKLSQHPFPRENALRQKEWASFVAIASDLDLESTNLFSAALPAIACKRAVDAEATWMTNGRRQPKLVAKHPAGGATR
jgi:hypothetical protein